MIEKILHLRSLSVPIPKIAEECGMTVGQVKYTLRRVKATMNLGQQGASSRTGSTQTESSSHSVESLPQAEIANSGSSDLDTPGEVAIEHSTGKEAANRATRNADTALGEKKEEGWKLPSFYARDLVKLMVQSPDVLFVYWEITWPRMRMVASYFQSDYQAIQKGIRLYDVTDRYFNGANAHAYRDIYVHEEASSWYIRGVQPGRTYIADFGLFHEDRFCPILRSEPVATPRNQPAVWGDPLIKPAADHRFPDWFENFSSYSVYLK